MKRSLSLALPLLLAGALLAQPGPGPRPGPGPGGFAPEHGRGLAHHLALTPEQRTAWAAIENEQRAATEGLFEQQRTLHEQIEDATDPTTIGTLVLQQRAIRAQLDAARDAALAKLKAILTAEQLARLAAFEQHPRRGFGPPPPPR